MLSPTYIPELMVEKLLVRVSAVELDLLLRFLVLRSTVP